MYFYATANPYLRRRDTNFFIVLWSPIGTEDEEATEARLREQGLEIGK